MKPMDDLTLPPLPLSPYLYTEWTAPEERVSTTMYTADQMREYARKAVEAEREACARVADLVAREIDDTNCTASYIAAAIRARKSD